MTITKDTILGDILDAAPETRLCSLRSACIVWAARPPAARTVEQACYVHGQDVDALLAKLNAAIAGK
jgi:hypothetical protein